MFTSGYYIFTCYLVYIDLYTMRISMTYNLPYSARSFSPLMEQSK